VVLLAFAFAAMSSFGGMLHPADRFLSDYYGKLSYSDYSLLDRAVRILEGNSGGKRISLVPHRAHQLLMPPWTPHRGILPSPAHFNGIWSWDAAFHMMAVVRWDAELARDQMRILEKYQCEDGMYPDVIWLNGSVSVHCTKPPVVAWAVWCVDRVAPDDEFLSKAYASLVKNEAFWTAKRFSAKDGLFHYDGNSDDPEKRKLYAGWESGWDNSPRWDNGAHHLYPIDLQCWMILTYRSLRDMAIRLRKPDDAERWRTRASELRRQMFARLWDDETGSFWDYDYKRQAYSRVLTPVVYFPLYIGIATREQSAALARHLKRLSPGWPTVAYDEPTYDPTAYWRGRTWLNVAYFALKGLKFEGYDAEADLGRREILKWIAADAATIYENYDSKTTLPIGAPNFGWSCVFTIKFLLDWEHPRGAEMPESD